MPPTYTGHSKSLHTKYIFWLPQAARYSSMSSLQSAGRAQDGPVGYQKHVISDHNLRGGGDANLISSIVTYRLRGNLYSHAFENELLHTSPPQYKTVLL